MAQRFIKKFLIGLCLNLILSFPFSFAEASMNDYCSIPPFAATKVKPNVVFLMDFSGSMQFPAYYDCDFYGYFESKVAYCGSVSATYNPKVEYYGYFDSEKYYVYDKTLKAWKILNSCFIPKKWKRIGYRSCFSGNFLNFLTTTRIDAALKALIGGKGNCSGSNCVLMPQGSVREVYVTFSNKTASCTFLLYPQKFKRGNYSSKHMLIASEWEEDSSCPFNKWKGTRRADVIINASERHGVLQDNFDKVDMSFMVFASNDRYGEVRYSFYEKDLDKLIKKVQNEIPYAGTPTGEAMWEVEDFLKQEDDHYYESNYRYIERDSYKDPYYMEINGNLFPLPCRKSYVVLVSDGEWNGDEDPVKPAYDMHVNDLRDDIEGNQTAEVFTLYAFSHSKEGKNSMETIAAFGSFKDTCSNNWPYPFEGFPENSRKVNWPVNSCNPSGSYNSCCSEWDSRGDGQPDDFFAATNGKELEEDLRKVFEKILSPTSGTSVGSISKKNVKGAVVCQSMFYSHKNFGNDRVSWIGYVYTWWFLNTKLAQNIREDTNRNKVLDVLKDYILDWTFEDGNLVITKYQSDSKGNIVRKVATYDSPEYLNPLFEVGEKLSYLSPQDRVIYTEVGNSLVSFDASNLNKFAYFLGDDLPSCLNDDKSLLVDYIRGKDVPGCRSRKVDTSGDTWKLGDIVYSSPVIVKYQDYSVIYVGSNDGMLHAFRLGYLKKRADAEHPAELDNSRSDSGKELLGEELWAFIPKNALPYLRYLADPNYCHIYYVDLTPYVVNIDSDGDGKLDKKILIGGMRLGGATGSDDPSAINPPSDTCSSSSCVGLSSYFALDITDPENPKFLWEFTDKDLGFSYSGPGIIKENGKYYVVFASGPVNYKGEYSANSNTLKIFILDLLTGKELRRIDTGITDAFAGKIFKEGADLNGDGNTDYLIFGYSKQQMDGFGGGLIVLAGKGSNSAVLYPLKGGPDNWVVADIGAFSSEELCNIVKKQGGFFAGKGFAQMCSNMSISFTSLPPVTSKVEVMPCFDKWYVYFGTGKWFYKTDDAEKVPEICLSFGNFVKGCTPGTVNRNFLFGIPILPNTGDYKNFDYIVLVPPIPAESLDAFELIPAVGSPISNLIGNSGLNNSFDKALCKFRAELKNLGIEFGWFIPLDESEGEYLKEKALSNPTVTKNNVVIFTTSQPTMAPCKVGGRSRVWALNCALGWSIDSPVNCDAYGITNLYGTLLLQLSGSNIKQIKLEYISSKNQSNIRKIFSKEYYRTTNWLTGITPESAPPFIYPSSSYIGTLLLWLEM